MALTPENLPQPPEVIVISDDDGGGDDAHDGARMGDSQQLMTAHHVYDHRAADERYIWRREPTVETIASIRTRTETPENDGEAETANDFFNDAFVAPLPDPNPVEQPRGQLVDIDGEAVFIPDSPSYDEQHLPHPDPHDASITWSAPPNRSVSNVDDCLQQVLAIFPDISHAYVHDLFHEFDNDGDYETLPAAARFDNIIQRLVTGEKYPKQEKGKQAQRKRKRQDDADDTAMQPWEGPDRIVTPQGLNTIVRNILKAEFPEIPKHYIARQVSVHKHLFQTYVSLAKAKDDTDDTGRPVFGKGRPAQHIKDTTADNLAAACAVHPLREELLAARQRIDDIRMERAVEEAKVQAEEDNLQSAIEAGRTAECQVCFDDLPMNRQIHCDGPVAHFTCFSCADTYIGTQIGDAKCQVLCTAGCGAGFVHSQLNLLSNKSLLAKLAQLQQEKDIRDAAMDDLEECPWCDYKAIAPPIDVDFEFRCENPECEKVSCRRCRHVSHIPLSCQEYARDHKLSSRHQIEEAMTAALVRSCNNCKKPFIKDHGCNKMTCPSCQNLQCYVCSETITNYNHFEDQARGRHAGRHDRNSGRKCVLYDNVEERHEREVKEAEAVTRAQIIEDNPDVTEEDLQIKVSEPAKKKPVRSRNEADQVPALQMMHHLRYPVFGWAGLDDNAVEDPFEGYEHLRGRFPELNEVYQGPQRGQLPPGLGHAAVPRAFPPLHLPQLLQPGAEPLHPPDAAYRPGVNNNQQADIDAQPLPHAQARRRFLHRPTAPPLDPPDGNIFAALHPDLRHHGVNPDPEGLHQHAFPILAGEQPDLNRGYHNPDRTLRDFRRGRNPRAAFHNVYDGNAPHARLHDPWQLLPQFRPMPLPPLHPHRHEFRNAEPPPWQGGDQRWDQGP